MIYLDNAASTPLSDAIKNKLLTVLDIYGNPSSIHKEGVKSKELIYEAKNKIARKLNCNPDELYFTSGATMSNNIILQGFTDGSVAVSEIEHEDILMLANILSFNKLKVSNEGLVKLHDYDIKDDCLYSIQMANSEIGTIQDIKELSKIIHTKKNAFLHVDATQYIPYFEVDVKKLGIDALSMSGQKINCLKGTGLLFISDRLQPRIKPLIYGKQGLVGGTENVLGISCLGEAFDNLNYNNENMIKLRDKLISGLDGELIGSKDKRIPNNVCMKFDNVDAKSLVMLLSEYDVCCSAGSACSSGDSEPSSTLLSIGLTPKEADSCVRFTLSKNTTEEEINTVIDYTNKLIDILKDLNE